MQCNAGVHCFIFSVLRGVTRRRRVSYIVYHVYDITYICNISLYKISRV